MLNRKKFTLPLLLCLLSFYYNQAEIFDGVDLDRFCYPNEQNNPRKICECINNDSPELGIRAIRIDCSFRELKSNELSEMLPLYTNHMDVSWNALEKVPAFYSERLSLLNLMHNNISNLVSNNFANISNLQELYLNWNSIQTIEANAFFGLNDLRVLDLSHNNMHALSSQIFSPLWHLRTLSLAWNRQLNTTQGIEEKDLFEVLGVENTVTNLNLEACSISSIWLPKATCLKELNLRRNYFTEVPAQLPETLEILDISENPFETLRPSDTKQLTKVTELFIEDMPFLASIDQNSLASLSSLKKLSLQNSRHLNEFHAEAFGSDSKKYPSLNSLIFRGSSVRSFNVTLLPLFQQLKEFDLNGVPLQCDCNLEWMKELQIETNGRCFYPSSLRGLRLSDAKSKDFTCDTWPRWIYGFVTLGLIILCSAGIYLLVMGLRPTRRVTMRRKVGAGSPYARVTIEPNRQENNYF